MYSTYLKLKDILNRVEFLLVSIVRVDSLAIDDPNFVVFRL